MNFFEHQQQARVNSKRLIVLFALAVLGTVLAVNLVVAVAGGWAGAFTQSTGVQVMTAGGATYKGGVPVGLHLLVTALTLAVIGGGTAWEMNKLRSGGDAVAQMVGARPVDPSTQDLLERRLLNVVEEMALAAGMPVPRVYVMDQEAGINAFAAGHHVNDAVVAVTRGTLTRLSRDELQGVVAHEFSHILNGDMALNLRLIGVLFGLMMIALAGRFLLEMGGRGNRDSKGAGGLALVGIGLWLVGYIGVFFGRMIKAGVSRQREFLADASAVQFTRNPDGIGGALRKIGGLNEEQGLGSRIEHAHAETLSHLFLGAARPSFAAGWLATHPALPSRIERIYGRAQDYLPAPEQPLALALADASATAAQARPILNPAAVLAGASPVAALAAPAASAPSIARSVGTAPAPATGHDGRAAPTLRAQAQALDLEPALADSLRAPLLVLALLVDKHSALAGQQRAAIVQTLSISAADEVERLHERVAQLPPGLRLPLLDLAMPALRKSPPEAADKLLMLAHTLILADGRVTLPEFLLFTVLKRRIGPQAHRAAPVAYRRWQELAGETALVLSLVAHARAPADAARAFAAGAAVLDSALDAPSAAGSARSSAVPALTPLAQLRLDDVGRALARLNQLAPLAKPALIKAVAATAYLDGHTEWRAASCLRTVCIALDAPLPPRLAAEGDEG
jgi:Zn-dependent protease with chaperone function